MMFSVIKQQFQTKFAENALLYTLRPNEYDNTHKIAIFLWKYIKCIGNMTNIADCDEQTYKK